MNDDEDDVPPPHVAPRYCHGCLDRWQWGNSQAENDRIHPACRVALEKAAAS